MARPTRHDPGHTRAPLKARLSTPLAIGVICALRPQITNSLRTARPSLRPAETIGRRAGRAPTTASSFVKGLRQGQAIRAVGATRGPSRASVA